MANSPEQYHGNGERGAEIGDAASERAKELEKSLENRVEQSPDARKEQAEKARAEASKEALMSREAGSAERKRAGEPSAPRKKRPTQNKKNLEASFKGTMTRVQSEMGPGERVFSKFIHNRVVEKTSDGLAATVARPNAILAGSICAVITVVILYFFAKHKGFTLSGFEAIGAFAVGWLLGILFDFFKAMITGKRA